MNWWAVVAAGLLAGATTCAVAQGGLLVGLIARQKKSTGGSGGRADATGGVSDDLIPVAGFLVGKLIMLTAVGFLLGAIGSVVEINPRLSGLALILAAAVMVVFGLSTLGVPGFRSIVVAPPASWSRVVRRSTRSSSAFAPFLLGLATVLIPCGVTISMMLLAATTGSAWTGAAVMALFVLGTAPLFTLFGFVTQRYVSADNRILTGVLGAVVMLFGLFTLNSALVALGSPFTAQNLMASASAAPATAADQQPTAPAPPAEAGVQTLHLAATASGYQPSTVSARAGVDTKLVIRTKDTYSCIVATVLPTLDKAVTLPVTGETTLDLGVLAAGTIPISCSMGMYNGAIEVS